jgi:LuxR family transcriptional regulator, maltose regulon positive regulatory protein
MSCWPGSRNSCERPDAELAVVAAGDELARGTLAAAGRYLERAERGSACVPASRQGQFQILLGVVRLMHARHRGNMPAVAEQARRLWEVADAGRQRPAGPRSCAPRRRSTSAWPNYGRPGSMRPSSTSARPSRLARQTGRPYIELYGLAYQAAAENRGRSPVGRS